MSVTVYEDDHEKIISQITGVKKGDHQRGSDAVKADFGQSNFGQSIFGQN